MSIARTAPDSFELQDLVCIELTLRFGFDIVGQMLVEPQGGEDASLFTSGPSPRHYEIQVKGVSGTVALKHLALWFTHFPEYNAEQMLLERLIADPDRFLIFVISGRASDAIAPLVAPRDWAGNDLAGPPATLAMNLLDAFLSSAIDGSAKGNLLNKRIAHHKKNAEAMTKAQISAVLRRTIIIEGITLNQVRADIGQYLAARGIPNDRLADVIDKLRSNIGPKRKDGTDVAPAISAQIECEAPTTVMPQDYIKGINEDRWIEQVSTANCLLLSGVTRSGKSFAARFVAANFERQGTRVKEFGTVEAAERFLFDGSQGARLAVLDDPLGGAHAAVDPDRQLQRLASLLPRLEPRRRLIVAQGRERLLEVAGVAHLDDAAVNNHAWVNTARRPANFRAKLWLSFAEKSGLREPLRSKMAQAIDDGKVELELGSLEFLANLPDALSGIWSVAEAERAARIDAATLSRALALEFNSSVLMALAVASAARAPINDEELAFVTHSKSTILPSKVAYLGLMFSIGGDERAPAMLPEYEGTVMLNTEICDDLDALEQRRMITISRIHGTEFTHPFYRAAAEIQLRNPTRRLTNEMLSMHERALFCRAPHTSRAAARNLDWLLEIAEWTTDVVDEIFRRAEAGLESLFPTTRDLCFDFIRRHSDRAEAALTNDIAQAARRVSSIELESLDWIDGEAILPIDGHVRDDAVVRGWAEPNDSEIAPALDALATNGSALTPEAAAETLLYLKNRPGAMQVDHVMSLLSYEEGVLRADAARTWLTRRRSKDEVILARIFADSHPQVAHRALNGVIACFNSCGVRRRARLLDGLAEMAVMPANAPFLLERLVLFDRDPPEADARPWPIFARLMPLVFDCLPVGTSFIEARLHNTMHEAGKHLPAEELAVICYHWVAWIKRMDDADRSLNDFALGVLDILFRYCADRPDLRVNIVKQLLSVRITSSLLTVIKDTVDLWADLSAAERDALIYCLATDAPDARWRRAVALTRSELPAEIEAILLPAEVRLADGAASVRDAIQPDLFAACMGIVCSYPGRLGEWRTFPPTGIWHEAVKAISRQPSDPLFDAAFSCIAERAERTDPDFIDCLTTAARIDADAVFEHLLERSIYDGAVARAEHWQELLAIGPADGNRDRWFNRMGDVAHEIVDKAFSLEKWMLNPIDREQIEARLTNDRAIYTSLMALVEYRRITDRLTVASDDDNDNTAYEKFAELVILLIEKRPPRFLATVDDVRNVLEQNDLLTEERSASLKDARELLIKTHDTARKFYSDLDRTRRPADWIISAL